MHPFQEWIRGRACVRVQRRFAGFAGVFTGDEGRERIASDGDHAHATRGTATEAEIDNERRPKWQQNNSRCGRKKTRGKLEEEDKMKDAGLPGCVDNGQEESTDDRSAEARIMILAYPMASVAMRQVGFLSV